MRQAIPVMLTLLSGNIIAPYEIKATAKQQEGALKELVIFLGFPSALAADVCQALMAARKEIDGKSGWMPWAVAAGVGVGMFVLGPVGLVMAAPAGLYGGAAIVAALAAFGPGGMAGGLAMMGGLMAAGSGMAAAAANALVSAPEAVVEHAVALLLARAIALEKRKLPRDDRVWFVLCELQAQIARELQRLRPISDKDAPSVKTLERKAQAVRRAIEYLIEHGLGPPLLTDQTS